MSAFWGKTIMEVLMYIDLEKYFGHSFETLVNPNPTRKSQNPTQNRPEPRTNENQTELKPTCSEKKKKVNSTQTESKIMTTQSKPGQDGCR